MKVAARKAKKTTASSGQSGLAVVLPLAVLFSIGGHAASFDVAPGAGTLSAAITSASPGDELRLRPGVYSGNVTVDKTLTLTGNGGSILDGGNVGRVLTIAAPDVVVRGLQVRGSGDRLDVEDSGIFVTEAGDRLLLEANHLEGNLIGVNLKGPDDVIVRDNTVIGSRNPRVNDRGNGVHLWSSVGTVVEGNTLKFGRDGIFVMTSGRNVFRDNHISEMRYAIHYMYTHDSEVSDNIAVNNNSAYALMYSERLRVSGNLAMANRERGLFLNAANTSAFDGNVVSGGTEKCVFIYNANMNAFTNNHFEDCDIGIHFTGSEQNSISGNSFIGNRTQVKYVGTRHIEWSMAGRGNYWSDNPSFDLNGDGIADRPYRPNDMVDQLLWKHPAAKLLINTPAMELLRWAQAEFPAVYPGGVVDSSPLMRPSVAGPAG